MPKSKFIFTVFCISLMLCACSKEDFTIKKNANDAFHVKNGDYLIPVLVRGNTASKKIILYIQGGPVINSLDYAKINYPGWKNTLEKDYAVAYYDQRGTGNMQGNFTQGQSVLSTWIEDLHTVAAFLKKTYDADIIMLGHSFGGGLMYRYMIAKSNAAIPVKYISSNAPATTDADTDTLRWKFRRTFLINTANLEISKGRNITQWNEALVWLKDNPIIKKVDGTDPFKLMRQWNKYVEDLIAVNFTEKSLKVNDYAKAIFTSSYNPLSANLNGKYRDDLTNRLLREEESDDLMPKLPAINKHSVLIMTGLYDDICPPEELNYILNKITSPKKKIHIFDNSGHDPITNQPLEFFNAIKQFIE